MRLTEEGNPRMRAIRRAAASTLLALLAACSTPVPAPTAAEDPHQWLEDVSGERALAWVRERNAASQALLEAQPGFGALRQRLREILESRDRIPSISRIGPHVYNFWTDAANPRGLWRRTTLADYRSAQPRWEGVLDVDALGRAEGVSWVWGGASCLPARTEAGVDRCMVALSRGGADARVVREFDLVARQFVAGGFVLPEAKTRLQWLDRDTLFVTSDFGPGTLTTSGYPRQVRRWARGTPLAAAPVVFEGEPGDVAVGVSVQRAPGFERVLFERQVEFHRKETFVLEGGRLARLDVPADASLSLHRDLLLLQLRSPHTVGGTTHPAGALLATSLAAVLRGDAMYERLFTPTPTRNLARYGVRFTGSRVLLQGLDNVAGWVEELWREDGAWRRRPLALPGAGQLWVTPLHDPALLADPLAEDVLLGYHDFLQPDTLLLGRTGTDRRETLKQRPAIFDAQGMRVEQAFATSRDGTRVPYFVAWPKGARTDGANPTLLYGYGGFQESMLPGYSPSVGSAWLARGGVYVLANIRGGGEFGPAWHQAALKANRQRSFDDFIAVAEDLVRRGITSPRHLGIMGGSNGGLLVAAVTAQRPELFNAVVSQAPLLDMRRYPRLLAGASWIGEYGDPDRAEDWAYLARYSPYHHVQAGARYPQWLLTTSTRDDRVHPAHARKMVARLESQGHAVLYYENLEGGHAGAADAAQRAHLQALEFSYLWMRLGRRDELACRPPRPARAGAPVPT